MVINVEYNQLDPLLRASGYPDGDVNSETGYSPFPGNINQVRLSLHAELSFCSLSCHSFPCNAFKLFAVLFYLFLIIVKTYHKFLEILSQNACPCGYNYHGNLYSLSFV